MMEKACSIVSVALGGIAIFLAGYGAISQNWYVLATGGVVAIVALIPAILSRNYQY